MEAELIWNDDQDGPVIMSPSEILVYWPQKEGHDPQYLLRVTEFEGELQVLVSHSGSRETECVWSAMPS